MNRPNRYNAARCLTDARVRCPQPATHAPLATSAPVPVWPVLRMLLVIFPLVCLAIELAL